MAKTNDPIKITLPEGKTFKEVVDTFERDLLDGLNGIDETGDEEIDELLKRIKKEDKIK